METTLYRKNRLGVGSWRIYAEGNIIHLWHASVANGNEIHHTEEVPGGLGGRTLEEQIASRINSRISKQRDKGYVETYEEAVNNPLTNTLNMPPPMLAKKIGDLRSWPGKCVVQKKFDGYRCIAARDGDVLLYSRQGKNLEALVHIRNLLEPHLTDDIMLDGELYLHGIPLQTVGSWAKRLQSDTARLVYHVYDSISQDPFPQRYEAAKEIVGACDSEKIVLVDNVSINQEKDMWEEFTVYRAAGYEGAMLRTLHTPYESGARSSSLYKVKARHDAEFEVEDVVQDANGNGVLICKMDGGKRFRTSAPGTHDQKRFILVHKDQYIGRQVTVEYANLTNDGIPFHCVATRFREDL